MPAAQLFSSELPAASTPAAARDFVRDFLVSKTGWTHVKSYLSSGNEYAVFTASGVAGYLFFYVNSSGYLYPGFANTFDGNATLGTAKTGSITTVISASQSTALTLVVHPELVLLRAVIGTTAAMASWFFPLAAGKPSWWNAAEPYVVLGSGNLSTASFVSAPSGSTKIMQTGITAASTRLGGRVITLGLVFTTASEPIGWTSTDLGLMPSESRAAMDTEVVQAGAEEYLILSTLSGTEVPVIRSV